MVPASLLRARPTCPARAIVRATRIASCSFALACAGVIGCSSPPVTHTDADYEAEIIASMHQQLQTEVQGLELAAVDLQAALPTPTGRGWDDSDQPAIDEARAAWIRMRLSWERAEGTLAALFPDIDGALDSRYEDMLKGVVEGGDPAGDQDLFDDRGVVGMHALERILFARSSARAVTIREAALVGYKAAAWPATEEEAAELKTQLAARLLADTQQLVLLWEPQAIKLGDVFEGLVGLMDAQQEKVSLAADHEEESRYARTTMADLRSNLSGTRAIYALFIPWLGTKSFGTALDHGAQVAFERMQRTYDTVPGDALPEPPGTWSSEQPSPEDQRSAFGQLYLAVVQEVDPNRAGSAVDSMNRVAGALGFSAVPSEE
jgi:iron uptake system component EfeO